MSIDNTDDVLVLLPGRRHGLMNGHGLAASGRKARVVWTLEQKAAVMQLCSPHVSLLKQKKCDAGSIAAKNRTWAEITRTYNAQTTTGDIRSAFEIKGVFERVTSSARLKIRENDMMQPLDKAETIIAEALIATQDPILLETRRECHIPALKHKLECVESFSNQSQRYDDHLQGGETEHGGILDLTRNGEQSKQSDSGNESNEDQKRMRYAIVTPPPPQKSTSGISIEELRNILAEESRLRIKVMLELYTNMIRFREVVEPKLLAVLQHQLAAASSEAKPPEGHPSTSEKSSD